MANEGDLKITKGSTKTYTYYGDSGKSSPHFPNPSPCLPSPHISPLPHCAAQAYYSSSG